IEQVGNQIQQLSQTYPDKEIIILETGYPWTDRNFDNSGNIINDFVSGYGPPSPSHQLAYLVDLTKEVMSSGGDGVIFWESAWVTTPCYTPWAQGSSHDHVVFFEPFTDNFIGSGGGLWMNPDFYGDMNSVQVIFKVDMTEQDVSDGVYISGNISRSDTAETKQMYDEGDGIFSYTTYLSPEAEGSYYFQTGEIDGIRETIPDSCSVDSERPFTIGNNNKELGYKWGTCETIVEETTEPSAITVTFAVNMADHNISGGVYVTGDFTRINGSDWSIEPMEEAEENIFVYTTEVEAGDEGGYYFLDGNDWNDRETVPSECVGYYDADRGYFIQDESKVYAYYWSSCETFDYMPTSSEEEKEIPGRGSLHQNYPNPFNPSTLISYEIDQGMYVNLSLYNLLGQEVKTLESGYKSAGLHYVNFDADGLPSGTYLYKITTTEFTENKKLTIIK
ncbi:MAG: glycosyl hydrolase 53 family protein, partial [Balneolaceae bacterium]